MLERKQGLISVYDKTGIIDFCKRISSHFNLISTGKTADLLESSNIQVKTVSDFTKYPEILGGRVKTLHPSIMGGILGKKDQFSEMRKMEIQPFGLVVVNLYPFQKTINQTHELSDALENIDIGGVTLLRAAAKNFHEVIVICSPLDYESVAEAIINESITLEQRKELAKKAFLHTAKYDAAISRYFVDLTEDEFPSDLVLDFENPQELRYGENWHQKAKYYLFPQTDPFYKQLHGKLVSLNNLLDFQTTTGLFSDFDEPACAIIKHTSPCGFATTDDVETAFDHAFETDKLSAFGSAMGFNRPITEGLAKKLNAMFVDAIIAPKYDEEAFKILTRKEKIVLCEYREHEIPQQAIRVICNGALVQSTDKHKLTEQDLKVVTKKKPTPQETIDLIFAWRVVKHVKSNSAVISTRTRTLGIGMGQTSRIDAVELALKRAKERAKGAVMASDAFFPYRDSVDAAVQKGVTAIIAPGGSIRDSESIEAADEAEIAMIWTGVRSFLH